MRQQLLRNQGKIMNYPRKFETLSPHKQG